MIVTINPDTNSVNVRGDDFIIRFDAVINERPSTSGASKLSDLVLISPRDGQPDVDWHRSSITLHPPHGWRRNTVYTVTLLPGISDLQGNVRRNTTEVTFSTGPTIPATTVAGTVFDAVTGAPVPDAFVEARPVSDSTLVYVAATDSTGRFHLRGLAPAQYAVRGYDDQNRNRGLDLSEPLDSMRVTLADSLSLELLTFVHDTTGPQLRTVSVQDSVTIIATFGTPLDPKTPLDAAHFLLTGPDSVRVAIKSVRTMKPDTTPVDTVPVTVKPQSAVPFPNTRPAPAVAPLPKPTRPLLFRDVTIVTATRLVPGATYRLQAADALSPTGVRRTSDQSFTVPKPATPSPAPAPPDSTRARPAVTPPAVQTRPSAPPARPPARTRR
jgi:hypothetical protein